MSLKTRKTIILAKVETTYGTDATPDGTNNAILVTEPTITPLAGSTVSRNNARTYLGNNQHIHVGSHVQCSFKVELAGGGAVDTAPPWGELLEGCGMAETVNPDMARTCLCHAARLGHTDSQIHLARTLDPEPAASGRSGAMALAGFETAASNAPPPPISEMTYTETGVIPQTNDPFPETPVIPADLIAGACSAQNNAPP